MESNLESKPRNKAEAIAIINGAMRGRSSLGAKIGEIPDLTRLLERNTNRFDNTVDSRLYCTTL